MPVLHLLAGPNAAGKTTFYQHLLYPATRLPFINADLIAKREWPGDEEAHGHDASALAEQARKAAIAAKTSFIAETVFSHVSKLQLIEHAKAEGYSVTLHIFIVPEELSVVRARLRSGQGGHSVPEDVLRARYQRLWALIEKAIPVADEAFVYDNSSARKPFRLVAQYQDGVRVGAANWPAWSPLK